ncbi:MAG: hypothetical protein M1823_000655 [Watsoniomyces obsoletus]|nr:MAG: hypothetical protein M1823_000655 [Watsoniomyces obsoletus]
MPSMEELTTAMINRSIRNIRMEFEFLADSAVITPQQLANALAVLPEPTALRGSAAVASASAAGSSNPILSVPIPPSPPPSTAPAPAPLISAIPISTTPVPSAPTQPPVETAPVKQEGYFPSPGPYPPAPPAYSHAPVLAWVTALYAYNGQDPGDLVIMPSDRIAVLEYTNGDWWKGRNERTGQEGIFPRSYVQADDARTSMPPPSSSMPVTTPNYGNMPLAVSQGPVTPVTPGPVETQGKKFGKKLGNAAIFGAGATIGSNIVNKIS